MNSQLIQQNACAAQPAAVPVPLDTLVRLSSGELSCDERQLLIAQILRNPSVAQEAKLALRLGDQAMQTASIIVQRAEILSAKQGFGWSLRTLAAGGCAGLLMFFAFGGQQNVAPERAVVAINIAPEAGDQIMSSSGFEAPDADFGGSFE